MCNPAEDKQNMRTPVELSPSTLRALERLLRAAGWRGAPPEPDQALPAIAAPWRIAVAVSRFPARGGPSTTLWLADLRRKEAWPVVRCAQEFAPLPTEWSPDGRTLVYEKQNGAGLSINADGRRTFAHDAVRRKSFQLTLPDVDTGPGMLWGDAYRDWTPAGDRLVISQGFSRYDEARKCLACFDLRRGKRLWIGPRPGVCTYPRWSPDGGRIAFARADESIPMEDGGLRRRAETFRIWTLRADGSGARKVTGGTGTWDTHPQWIDARRLRFRRHAVGEDHRDSPGTAWVLDLATGSATPDPGADRASRS